MGPCASSDRLGGFEQPEKSLEAHCIIADENALVEFDGNTFCLLKMRCILETPRPPKQRGCRGEHWPGDSVTDPKGRAVWVIQIGHHREVFGHVETGYENGLYVLQVLVAGELDPRFIVGLNVLFKRTF